MFYRVLEGIERTAVELSLLRLAHHGCIGEFLQVDCLENVSTGLFVLDNHNEGSGVDSSVSIRGRRV